MTVLSSQWLLYCEAHCVQEMQRFEEGSDKMIGLVTDTFTAVTSLTADRPTDTQTDTLYTCEEASRDTLRGICGFDKLTDWQTDKLDKEIQTEIVLDSSVSEVDCMPLTYIDGILKDLVQTNYWVLSSCASQSKFVYKLRYDNVLCLWFSAAMI